MSIEVKPLALKNGAIVILRALEKAPMKFAKLRVEYFGEGRAKQPATTSFYTQTKTLIGKGLVEKTADGYTITELGRVSIEAVEASVKAAAKSEAQVEFENSAVGQAYQKAKDLAATEKVTA
jgi:predicted transcriptional regulator